MTIHSARKAPCDYSIERIEVATQPVAGPGGERRPCWAFEFVGYFHKDRLAIQGIFAYAYTLAEAAAECERWLDRGIPVVRAAGSFSYGGRCSR